MSNEPLKATLEILRERGIDPTVKHGGKHLHVEFEHGGRPRTIVVSATPSDRRAGLEARTVARRVCLRAPDNLELVALPAAPPETVEAPRVRQAPRATTAKDYSKTSFVPIGPEPLRQKPTRFKPAPTEPLGLIYQRRLDGILDRMIVRMRGALDSDIRNRLNFRLLEAMIVGAVFPYPGLRRSPEWTEMFCKASDEGVCFPLGFIYEHGAKMQQACLKLMKTTPGGEDVPMMTEEKILSDIAVINPGSAARMRMSRAYWEKLSQEYKEDGDGFEQEAGAWVLELFPIPDAPAPPLDPRIEVAIRNS